VGRRSVETLVFSLLIVGAHGATPFTVGRVLHSDDFRSGLALWTTELEKPGKVEAQSGVLSVDVPAGCTAWFRPELSGAAMIEYEARMIQAGGPNDRVSDLNAFWMATDSRSPDDLFATRRSGKFSDYNQLRTYYVGQGGNSNTTTRFRRYIGDAVERPLLPEHDLHSADVLLQPNVWQKVQLVALGNRIQYYRDGRLIFDYSDPEPYTKGHFGFRTTFSHVELRNFRIYAITAATGAPVSAKEDADFIKLDNGLVALDYSKRTHTFHAIYRYVDGKRITVAEGRGAYYWNAVSLPEQDVPDDAPNKGYFAIETNPRPLRLIATADSAEIVAAADHNAWFLFDAEIHYVLRRGDPGFYSYVVMRHPASLPAATLALVRFVSKTVTDGTLTHFVIGDGHIRPIDRSEVVETLANATFLLADGTVDTKYQNSTYWAETPVYGDAGPRIGIWSITASPEYHNGGPLKQGQTVHQNVVLRVLTSAHFGAAPPAVAKGEEWSKIFGPVFTYINTGDGIDALWTDAIRRQKQEAGRWPYDWVTSPEYVKDRGTLTGTGRLQGEAAKTGAWVVLSRRGRGEDPDWTLHGKGYQFWARTGPDGKFAIRNVIPGKYTLYISGADQPSDYSVDGVEIAEGKTTVRDVEWTPVHHGATLWQIGTFDRTAAEFRRGNEARDFEMFKHYPEDFPEDVTYTVGTSDPARDWNYAQWALYVKKPVWTIRFGLDHPANGKVTLTLAFASAQPQRGRVTNLQVKVNGRLIDTIHLPKTGTAGYRGGAQDSRWNVRTLEFDASLLHSGSNEITLGHAEARLVSPGAEIRGPVGQVMYDAIRLEVDR